MDKQHSIDTSINHTVIKSSNEIQTTTILGERRNTRTVLPYPPFNSTSIKYLGFTDHVTQHADDGA